MPKSLKKRRKNVKKITQKSGHKKLQSRASRATNSKQKQRVQSQKIKVAPPKSRKKHSLKAKIATLKTRRTSVAKVKAVKIRPIERKSKSGTAMLGWALILLSMIIFAYLGFGYYTEQRTLTLSRAEVQEVTQTTRSQTATPTHLTIEKLIDIDVEPFTFTNGKWVVSDKEGSYLLDSARPGENGNIVIYGHNLRRIFGNLPSVKEGNNIALTTSDGVIRHYRVKKTFVVYPNDSRSILPTLTETLTIYTCTGFLDSKRFIVQAVATNE
jgi:LPXTG-site transpeptidase (sortase) family protein